VVAEPSPVFLLLVASFLAIKKQALNTTPTHVFKATQLWKESGRVSAFNSSLKLTTQELPHQFLRARKRLV
jgi:hypothetical protein